LTEDEEGNAETLPDARTPLYSVSVNILTRIYSIIATDKYYKYSDCVFEATVSSKATTLQ